MDDITIFENATLKSYLLTNCNVELFKEQPQAEGLMNVTVSLKSLMDFPNDEETNSFKVKLIIDVEGKDTTANDPDSEKVFNLSLTAVSTFLLSKSLVLNKVVKEEQNNKCAAKMFLISRAHLINYLTPMNINISNLPWSLTEF